MIAAGLCMMGGCFAQDENAAAVDTYWAAESIHLVTGANLVIAEVIFLGGDSSTDVLTVTYQAASYGGSYLIAGLRAADLSIRLGNVVLQGERDWNLLGTVHGNAPLWYEPLNEKFTWWAKDGYYKRGDEKGELPTFSLDDAFERSFRIGGALAEQERYFYHSGYSNARTGVKAQWVPMMSTSGTALFETLSCTLAEQ